MTDIFDDLPTFLQHLETKLSKLDQESESTKDNLLHGCSYAIKYLLESQDILSHKFFELALILNDADSNWPQKLSKIYTIMEVGQINEAQMLEILKKEICQEKENDTA